MASKYCVCGDKHQLVPDRVNSLVNVTPKGAEVLRQLNVVAAFDFRSHPEIQRQGIMA